MPLISNGKRGLCVRDKLLDLDVPRYLADSACYVCHNFGN